MTPVAPPDVIRPKVPADIETNENDQESPNRTTKDYKDQKSTADETGKIVPDWSFKGL